MKRVNSQGQSFIEIIVAVGIMSLLLVALLSLITLSVKNSRFSKNRTQATTFSQEGLELMRAYRDDNWSEFKDKINVTAYQLPFGWVVKDGLPDPVAGTCTDPPTTFDIYEVFSRCVLLTELDASTIKVKVTTSWQEGSDLKQIEQTTNLTTWQI